MNDKVTSIDEKAKAQEDARLAQARERALILSSLMLGEEFKMGDDGAVMAVPGGWIFYRTHKAGITGTFVPAPPNRPKGDSLEERGFLVPS